MAPRCAQDGTRTVKEAMLSQGGFRKAAERESIEKQKKNKVFRSAVRWLLGAKTATGRPKMATRRPKTATRRAKMAPRCAQDAPEGPRCPKGRPRWTKTAPRWPAMASRWLKMVQNAARWPKMAPTWPQDGRPSTDGYGCVSFCRPPPADRCFESFAARRPPADAYRDVGRYAARRPSTDG